MFLFIKFQIYKITCSYFILMEQMAKGLDWKFKKYYLKPINKNTLIKLKIKLSKIYFKIYLRMEPSSANRLEVNALNDLWAEISHWRKLRNWVKARVEFFFFSIKCSNVDSINCGVAKQKFLNSVKIILQKIKKLNI